VRRCCGKPFGEDVAVPGNDRWEVVCDCGLHGVFLKYFLDKFVAFAAYWHLWSDYILHRIHLRVLEHIRTQAEGAVK